MADMFTTLRWSVRESHGPHDQGPTEHTLTHEPYLREVLVSQKLWDTKLKIHDPERQESPLASTDILPIPGKEWKSKARHLLQ